ncbi:MAG: hypothetical protein GX542_06090 [Rhodococcus sp.]|nr:hypothetical protein [Rhodococcus sp. (in: high G+C Gram-positive bacteria)]
MTKEYFETLMLAMVAIGTALQSGSYARRSSLVWIDWPRQGTEEVVADAIAGMQGKSYLARRKAGRAARRVNLVARNVRAEALAWYLLTIASSGLFISSAVADEELWPEYVPIILLLVLAELYAFLYAFAASQYPEGAVTRVGETMPRLTRAVKRIPGI